MQLSEEQRARLPSRDFAFPKTRAYPVNDRAHARNALARVSRFGTPAMKAKVCRVVKRRFPEIHETHCGIHRLKA